MARPSFSLVLATLGRADELLRYLKSLERQSLASYELIVVDQNLDDRVSVQLAKVSLAGEVIHLRSSPGLSVARNVGLARATGEIIAFPDDDCWYTDGLLEYVLEKFRGAQVDGITGRSIDDEGRESSGTFSRVAGPLDEVDVWSKAISYTIFLREAVCRSVGRFDEELGVGSGSPFGSGEETDYLIRALRKGFRLHYLPELQVGHPLKTLVLDQASWEKAYSYGAGMGRVLVKHRYPLSFRARSVALPLAGAAVAACRMDMPLALQRWYRVRGRLFGMMASTRS